jgi:glyoxylase-like metal-dependent hydrolase (beta-lactamase superfamily II)
MPKVEEVTFFHRATRTLLVTDCVFNLHNYETALSRFYFRITGVHGRVAQSPVFRLGVRDKVAAGRSIHELLALRPDRIVPCHGEVSEDREALSKALEKMASWAPSRPLKKSVRDRQRQLSMIS